MGENCAGCWLEAAEGLEAIMENDKLNAAVSTLLTEARDRKYDVAGTGWVSAVEQVSKGRSVLMVLPKMSDREVVVAAMRDPLHMMKVKIDKKLTTFREVFFSNGTSVKMVSASSGVAAILGVHDRALVFVYR